MSHQTTTTAAAAAAEKASFQQQQQQQQQNGENTDSEKINELTDGGEATDNSLLPQSGENWFYSDPDYYQTYTDDASNNNNNKVGETYDDMHDESVGDEEYDPNQVQSTNGEGEASEYYNDELNQSEYLLQQQREEHDAGHDFAPGNEEHLNTEYQQGHWQEQGKDVHFSVNSDSYQEAKDQARPFNEGGYNHEQSNFSEDQHTTHNYADETK